jgi:hypothetical protein
MLFETVSCCKQRAPTSVLEVRGPFLNKTAAAAFCATRVMRGEFILPPVSANVLYFGA